MASKVVECPQCGTKNRLPLAASGHPRCASCKTDLPWLIDAGDADFDAAVDTKALVVVDLWAPVVRAVPDDRAGARDPEP